MIVRESLEKKGMKRPTKKKENGMRDQ